VVADHAAVPLDSLYMTRVGSSRFRR
jgi:hypothetical protein